MLILFQSLDDTVSTRPAGSPASQLSGPAEPDSTATGKAERLLHTWREAFTKAALEQAESTFHEV